MKCDGCTGIPPRSWVNVLTNRWLFSLGQNQFQCLHFNFITSLSALSFLAQHSTQESSAAVGDELSSWSRKKTHINLAEHCQISLLLDFSNSRWVLKIFSIRWVLPLLPQVETNYQKGEICSIQQSQKGWENQFLYIHWKSICNHNRNIRLRLKQLKHIHL